MTRSWTRIPALAGLGLSAALGLALAGCGGKGQGTDEAVVVTEPGVPVSAPASGAAPATGAPATPTPAATSTSTSTAPSTAAPVKAEGWGTLKGQITFTGNPPARKELVEKGKAPKDPETCGKEKPIESERLIVDGSGGVKNVLVYFPKPTAVNDEAKSAANGKQVVFDQQHCVFEPHVLALMVGEKVELKNSDPVNHNINSRLKNNSFNSLLSGGQTQPRPIEGAERTPGELTCDIHPWMKAYWMVLDNPYYAVTDAKGNFEIKNAPAGTQKVVVWQEAVGFVTPASGENVAIKPNDTTTLDLKIDAGKVRPE